MSPLPALLSLVLVAGAPATPARHRFGLDDMARLHEVSDPQFAPDGAWIAYVVESIDTARDEKAGDIWMASWDGKEQVRLTSSPEDDKTPRFSPDGKSIAFLSARGGEDARTQVLLLNLAGGEPIALSAVPGDVEEFAWSPDGRKLALIVADPEPAAPKQGKEDRPAPIVVDRYQFKQDYVGYLTQQRSHLYLFDRDTRRATNLTPGASDEHMPAWSPDGARILFVSKRGGDPDRHWNWDLFTVEAQAGQSPRQLTSFAGGDNPPEWESAPAFSPDGRFIAYVRSAGDAAADQFYGGPEVAVIGSEGSGAPKRLTAAVDRWMLHPRWSRDGASVYFTLEDDRSAVLARVTVAGGPVERLVPGGRVVSGLDVGPAGRVVVVAGSGQQPTELFAVEGGNLRPLTHHNQALLASLSLGAVEEASLKSRDGTAIGAMLVKPPDFAPGKKYPVLLWMHGGPVMQDQHEFDSVAQFFAAQGYLVLSPNYRGSSGRGFAFSRAISADWGHLEVEDVLGAVDGLVAQGLADPERLVVGGWSYGGMLTDYVIASDTRFKAAVSIAGVANMLASYGTDEYVQWYEQELGLPWKAIDAYLKVSYPFFHADRIETPTLFICGEKDWNVPLVNSEQMYQALRSQGKQARLVIYPGAHHGIDAPRYRRDLLERMQAWYAEYLGVRAGEAARSR